MIRWLALIIGLVAIFYSTICREYEMLEENAKTNKMTERNEVEDKYKWNLEDLFKSDIEWENEYSRVKNLLVKVDSFKGKLGDSKESFFGYFQLEEELSLSFEKLRMYASMSKDLDLREPKYQAMFDRVMNLANEISTAISFVNPEIQAITESKVLSLINTNEPVKINGKEINPGHFKQYVMEILRTKKHTLSKEQEEIMSLAGSVTSSFMNIYRMYTGADIKYPPVIDPDGAEIEMSPARFYAGMSSKDRDYRERAYKSMYVPYMSHRNFLTANYNSSIKAKIFNKKARGYESTLHTALDQNNIPVDVYHNLVKTVNENLEPLQRWAEIKRKMLGVNRLHAYDTYVTIFEAEEKKYTPDEAMQLCLDALKPLGEDYIRDLKFAFENRWVDFIETPGKRSGAYSTGAVKGVHPYVLMNWGYTLNDVFTLAHEMGHNMHSWYTANTQDYPYADYPIFLAEVASTTNEALLLDYMLKNANSKEEKLMLIETALNGIKSTFYRQTRFAEFELTVQEMIENGKSLTPDDYAKVFGDQYQRYWGEGMEVDEEERNSWPRIHHFYYNFYVYQYATSYAASQAIAQMIKIEGQPAIDRYLNFLKSGNSDYAIPTLQKLGVDMTTSKPIEAVIAKANKLLDDLEMMIEN